jgi:hypothetical protein
MKRYAFVLLAALAVALVLGFAARAPHRGEARTVRASGAPAETLRVAFAGGVARPDLASVPAGRRVTATLVNDGPKPIEAALAGYEDRFARATIAPGESRTVTFLADRPGEAFAWLVDGEPCGRLAVTGSHLEEGHR